MMIPKDVINWKFPKILYDPPHICRMGYLFTLTEESLPYSDTWHILGGCISGWKTLSNYYYIKLPINLGICSTSIIISWGSRFQSMVYILLWRNVSLIFGEFIFFYKFNDVFIWYWIFHFFNNLCVCIDSF